ncbi:C4-dicarboxylate transport protein [Anatilimnocola aggregata]|uniref:C4-dicarboxylate transport protein n=1 Tax=Anatilimnocola aggregata TaxID=2528021 RepID=A0A517YK15_9BACT|nr:dicarboxylate/amino acid:cation symporter [Anatilimnocola aggregata]QDU30557.1 C4-dicarboxylate transport protein [Anatilimnocola aggregata]
MSANEATQGQATRAPKWNPLCWPLYLRVLLGVVLGTVIGISFPAVKQLDGSFKPREILLRWTTADLGSIASMYIDLLTALATPLIFFAVAEAFIRTVITARQGVKMFTICLVNIAVAFVIGLVILNTWQPGKAWSGAFAEYQQNAASSAEETADQKKLKLVTEQASKKSLSPLELVRSYIPKSFLQPFTDNMVLTVAVLAILVGAALRSLKAAADPELQAAVLTFDHLIIACYQIILKMLFWLIELAPYAICLAVIGVVGTSGLETFKLVGVFFLTTVTALSIHSLIYYPLSAWLIGGKSPAIYFREGASAILTGFSINSSLATAPLTLQALERMGVSDSSARLSACVGTNFNNDGITLYEAMTALFIAQVAGMDLSLGAQISILLAALAGSMGIAGIPNSGLIILTLVLRAANLSDETVKFAFPIVLSIDFIIARLRSAVNVMGDLQVAILLDAGGAAPEPAAPESAQSND